MMTGPLQKHYITIVDSVTDRREYLSYHDTPAIKGVVLVLTALVAWFIVLFDDPPETADPGQEAMPAEQIGEVRS